MGGVIAEALRQDGIEVTLATPSDTVSAWAGKTTENWRVRKHLIALGVGIEVSHSLEEFDGERARLTCAYSGAARDIAVSSVVMVTHRRPNDALYRDILARANADPLPFTLGRIGDCDAPAIIAAAVYAGHRYARELDNPPDPDHPTIVERIDVGDPVAARGGTGRD
jgi:dimethylamine/trimethylamine dehydrogenase